MSEPPAAAEPIKIVGPDNELKISLRRRDDACIMDIAGDVTVNAQSAFDRAYSSMAQTGVQTVVINLAGCDYVTSNGLSAIAGLVFQARHDGRRACLVGLTPHLQKLCRMMGLAGYAELFNCEEDALRTV